MKLSGRKFFGMIIGTIILLLFLVLTLLLNPAAVTTTVLTIYGSLVVFLITAFIGGNVFNSFVTSKHFQKDLLNQGKENE
jgi:uncharacterized integral membrane protein